MKIRIMKNNPAFLDRSELIRGFVVRHADLKMLTERLHEQHDGPCQHILVIAPRGMGKTTLVLRVVADVHNDKALAKKWYPIVFGEESYEVATAAELWLEALGHLGRQTGDMRWSKAYQDLKRERDEQRLYERALGQLMDFADEQQKKLLLVVENLNMILGEQLSADDGWTLRHTLQNEPRIMLLATATSRFDEIDNADKAMYDLFWTFNLAPLNKEECRTVWRALTGHELAGDRIRPVEILTGGSPRLLSILGSFAAEMSLRELMRNLAHLVDEHTSYFKSNLESLPVGERKVYVTLADIWSLATAREVADAARIDINKASASLHRLMRRGAVAEISKEGRTIRYQVTERLYNIYHLLRKHGDEESRVRCFVDFMIEYYQGEELVDAVRTITDEACEIDPEVRRDHFFAISGILKRLGDDGRAQKILAATNPRFFQLEDAPDFIKELPKKFAENMATHTEGEIQEDEPLRLVQVALEHWGADRLAEAEAAARQAVVLAPNSGWTLGTLLMIVADLGRHDEAEKLIASLEAIPPQDAPWEEAVGFAHRSAGQLDKARNAFERALAKNPAREFVLLDYAATCADLEDWPAAEAAFARATSLNENNADAWLGLSGVQGQLQKYQDAESSARRALKLRPDDAQIWRNLACSLLDQEHYTDECEEAIRRCMTNDSGDDHPFRMASRLHQNRLKNASDVRAAAERYAHFENGSHLFLASLALHVVRHGWSSLLARAESWAQTAVEKEPSAGHFQITLAMVLGVRTQWAEAFEHARKAIADSRFVLQIQALLQWFFFVAAGTGHVAESLAILSTSPAARELEPLVTALQLLDGQSPNAPLEILEVAKDIVKQVEAIRAARAPKENPPPKKAAPAPKRKSKR